VWGVTLLATFTFFIPKNSTAQLPNVQLQMQFASTWDLSTVYQEVFPGSPAPSFLSGAVATEQIGAVLSTGDYNSYPKGLVLFGTSSVAPAPNVLATAIQVH
jgi:hypothetical protein